MPTLKLTKKYDRYPKYKDSGVKWVGEIPEGWGLMRVKYLAPIRDEKYVFPNDGTPYVGLEHVESQTGKHIEPDEPVVPESIVNRFEINDVLFGKLRPYLAKVLHASFEGYCTGELLVMVPGKIIPRYLYYKMLDPSFVNNVNVSTYGARMPRASWNFIGNQYFAYPDEQTQKNIAACLDEKTVLIDAIIEKKKKQIELLREKRAAIINRAVTKGLPARRSLGEGGDTNAKLVDSGIEWIGKIPEGWEVKRLKYIANVQASNVDKNTNEGDSEVLLCNYVDVYKNEYITANLNFMKSTATHDQVRKVGLVPGDVLITKDSETADDIGVPALVKDSVANLVSGYHLYVMKPVRSLMVGDYLLRFLQSSYVHASFETSSNGVTRFGLGAQKVKDLQVLVPSMFEQKKIALYVNEKAEVADCAVNKIEVSIKQLQEFKSALISHVVTGKVKV